MFLNNFIRTIPYWEILNENSLNYKPQIYKIPKIRDDRGNLSFVEGYKQVPFKIERIYTIYDVPGGEIRGGHAYKNLDEFVIALSGSFDVVINDGHKNMVFSLNRSDRGLLLPKLYWRHMENFSTNSTCLVVASKSYDENDYIRDFDTFKYKLKNLNDKWMQDN